MNKWHYHSVQYTLADLMNNKNLNKHGELGWELICLERLEGKPTRWLAVFKKEQSPGGIPIEVKIT